MSIARQYGFVGEPVTKPVTKASTVTELRVAVTKTGRPPKGEKAMTAAERMKAYRKRKRSQP